jgi:hypothetical protein
LQTRGRLRRAERMQETVSTVSATKMMYINQKW